jgi:hypothetical protein
MNKPPQQPPNSPRARLQQLLAIPERQRTDAEWDELNEIEILLAVGNRDVIPQGVRRDGQGGHHQGQTHQGHQGQGQGHGGQGHGGQGHGGQGHPKSNRGPDGQPQQRKHKRPQKRKGR